MLKTKKILAGFAGIHHGFSGYNQVVLIEENEDEYGYTTVSIWG